MNLAYYHNGSNFNRSYFYQSLGNSQQVKILANMQSFLFFIFIYGFLNFWHCGCDHMIFRLISTKAISSRHHWGSQFEWQGVLDTTLCNKDYPMTCDMLVVFVDILVSNTNKTDHYDITEMLLKMALNTHSIVLFWPWKYGRIKNNLITEY